MAIEAIGKRLIASCGIVEAVAQDHLAGSKGRRDDLVHQLGARGVRNPPNAISDGAMVGQPPASSGTF